MEYKTQEILWKIKTFFTNEMRCEIMHPTPNGGVGVFIDNDTKQPYIVEVRPIKAEKRVSSKKVYDKMQELTVNKLLNLWGMNTK